MFSGKTVSLDPGQYLKKLTDLFLENGDPIRAERQRAYMRHQFEYCGLSAPEWLNLAKTFYLSQGMYTGKDLKVFLELCFEQEYREIQYAGIEMMQHKLKEQDKTWIKVIEKCIVTHSWWDTVDWLAKLTGIHFKRFPALQIPWTEKWMESENIWLQRTAIIHQLFYRETTNTELLFSSITRVADSKEFFLQKASGWALRQYAKTNPVAVQKFIQQQSLSSLTIREAKKELDK